MERFDLKVKGNNLIRKMIDAEPYIMQKPLTNADRNRAMTDEELAEMIANHVYGMECQNCPACDLCNPCMEDTTCRSTLLDWLKQEVKE